MPIYEYRCTDCSRKFEQIVLRGKALDDTSCPRCGSRSVERLLSSFSLSGVSRKSQDSFDEDFDAPESDFGDEGFEDDENLGIGEENDLGDSELEQGLDENMDEELDEEER
ncbi:MAG: zinc ribbon domain-containing protein [Acidobacteriota bacterium]